MKKRTVIIFLRFFAVFFIVVGLMVYIGFRDFKNLENLSYKFFEKNSSGKFNDYDDMTARIQILKAKAKMRYFKDNFSELSSYIDDEQMKEIRNIFDDADKRKYFKDFLSNTPKISDMRERFMNKRHSLMNEEKDYGFYREFMKKTSSYAVYCAVIGDEDSFIDTIDRMAGLSAVFSWGYLGKPLMIEYMIGTALKNITQNTVKFVLDKENSVYSSLISVSSIEFSFGQKQRLASILETLEKGMPTKIEAMEGEQYMGERFMDFLQKDSAYATTVIDLVCNPFTTTEKIMKEYYKEAVASIDDDEKYRKVYEKYSRKLNPIVNVSVMSLQKVSAEVRKSSTENKELILKLK